jgi:TolB protein
MRTALVLALAWQAAAQQRAPVASKITIVDRDGRNARVIHTSPDLFEAPNWSPDGKYLLLNSKGKLWKLAVDGGQPEMVDTGEISRVNNDHGISPDGRWFVISAGQMYLLPATGGIPKQITQKTPSYYHGWSPDGKTLAYCAPRDSNFDLYAIGTEGGEEKRLTTHAGYDDGPDYSPDGKWIYFNSDRSGSWDIWRIPAGGAGPGDARAERITGDEHEDWFPHPSPDGKQIVLISFAKGTKGHPANQNVVIRTMTPDGKSLHDMIRLFGGQGTMNVNSWSPDSQRFAYVSYELR